MASSSDPLNLAELDPERIAANIANRDKKTGKQPNELDLQKEARLAQKEQRLAAGSSAKQSKEAAGKPAPQDPPPAPPVSQMERSMLLDKIHAYRERFPNLKKRNNVTAKSAIEEIDDELHFIEMQLGSTGTTNIGATVLYASMYGLETMTMHYYNPLGLNLNGLGTVTKQNMDQFQPIIDELMIKHGAGAYTSPEWRLALMIGATVMTVNAANQNPEMARVVKGMNQAVNTPKNAADL